MIGDFDAGPCDLFFMISAGKRAVEFIFRGAAKDMSVEGIIGVSIFDEARDDGDHLGNIFGGFRLEVWREGVEFLAAFKELFCGGLGEFCCGDIEFFCALNNFVVDIGDIADVGDFCVWEGMTEQPVEDVKDDEGSCISDMDMVIDGGSADIESDVVWVDGRERFDRGGCTVVESERDVHECGSHECGCRELLSRAFVRWWPRYKSKEARSGPLCSEVRQSRRGKRSCLPFRLVRACRVSCQVCQTDCVLGGASHPVDGRFSRARVR